MKIALRECMHSHMVILVHFDSQTFNLMNIMETRWNHCARRLKFTKKAECDSGRH